MVIMTNRSLKGSGHLSVIFLAFFLCMLAIIGCVVGEVDYDLPPYQDPAGDVLEFNETWSNLGKVETQPQIDIKWLESSNDTLGNVVLRLEFKNNQVIEISNETKYVFRIFTKEDNSTGYNVTYLNGSATISNFNNTIEEDMTANISIINYKGEVLDVKVSKNRYLSNITYFNIDAHTWKEHGNHTYIDYVSEIPGHPGETGTVVDQDNGDSKEDKGLLGFLCSIPWILLIVIIIIIIVIIIIIARR
ncbi:MAG: hypothetical protein V3U20_00510 [Thermoplasmata archaeon]